jgi:hypothetical protein
VFFAHRGVVRCAQLNKNLPKYLQEKKAALKAA